VYGLNSRGKIGPFHYPDCGAEPPVLRPNTFASKELPIVNQNRAFWQLRRRPPINSLHSTKTGVGGAASELGFLEKKPFVNL
jgi:hypothetical protein